MKKHLERYVGRIVRLNKDIYEEILSRAIRKGRALENCFLVAEVRSGLRQLICYSASFRVVVDVADVVLV